MRRALVLTDEAARHPFRVMLPGAANIRRNDLAAGNDIGPRLSRDWRLFLQGYAASLVGACGFVF